MVYTPSTPTASQFISISQPLIQENFSQANTIFGANHVEFDSTDVANQGKHTFVSMIEQSSDPTTAVNEIALYTKDLGGINTLYMRKESDGTVIQLSGADPLAAASGYTFLPGGIILQWGTGHAEGTGHVNTFPIAFPNNCFSVTLTGDSTGDGRSILRVWSKSQANFTAVTRRGDSGTQDGAADLYFIAIGN